MLAIYSSIYVVKRGLLVYFSIECLAILLERINRIIPTLSFFLKLTFWDFLGRQIELCVC